MKTGLVLEGGAMRGMFTAGVLDSWMDEQISFDGIVGVSAGALFGINAPAGQKGRAIRYNLKYIRDKRYMGLRSLLTTGNLMVSPYILCGATFNISIWAGAGTFENGSTEMTLTNLTPDQTDAQGNGHYSWTEHSVRIKGADSHTRVSISTVAQKGYYRMWFDDLMIVRDDGGQSEGSSGSGSGGDYGNGGDGF